MAIQPRLARWPPAFTTRHQHIVFGDYTLDNDTHMEVRTGVSSSNPPRAAST